MAVCYARIEIVRGEGDQDETDQTEAMFSTFPPSLLLALQQVPPILFIPVTVGEGLPYIEIGIIELRMRVCTVRWRTHKVRLG